MKTKTLITTIFLSVILAGCSTFTDATLGTLGTINTAANTTSGVLGVTMQSDAVASHFSRKSEAKKNCANLNKLKKGQTRDQVIDLLGNPQKTETLLSKKGQDIEIFLYRIDKREEWEGNLEENFFGFKAEEKNKMLPVVFKDEILVGWGQEFYTKFKKKET